MKYDIASKVIIEASKEAILRKFLGLEPSVIEKAEELPEETFSLMRSDYHLRIAYDNGQEAIVIIEIQTRFSQEFIWRLIDYTARYMIKYKTEIIPLVLLLSPSEYASGIYRDKIFEFKYNVIRFW